METENHVDAGTLALLERTYRRMTLAEVAAKTGINRTRLGRIESGAAYGTVTVSEQLRLQEALGVPLTAWEVPPKGKAAPEPVSEKGGAA